MIPRLSALGLGLLLSGCLLGPEYTRPEVQVPARWLALAEAERSLAEREWWELYPDRTLQGLIRTALAENTDVRIAAARVLEARAQVGVTRAPLFPQLGGSGSYANTRTSEVGGIPLPPGVDPQAESATLAIDASFELDLWGRVRRATEAARAELLATEEARRTVVITLVGDVAQAYFDLLELDRELEIAGQTLASRRESLRIMRLREQEGIASRLDVSRAGSEVASAAAIVPDLERRIAQTEYRISILLGRNPGPVGRDARLGDEAPMPEVPAGLPSALLERRPDIRRAEQQLVASSARIGEARAAFFPRVSLTGSFGVASASASDILTGSARAWQFGPTVTVPIFQGFRLRYQLEATEARHQQALVQYQQVIQQAFREVEDALVAHAKAGEARPELEALVRSNQLALDLAELRYTEGLSSYLDVLDAQRQLFAAQNELARVARDQLTTVVQVYKALGGGWSADGAERPPPRPRPAP